MEVAFFLFWAAIVVILARLFKRKPHAKSTFLAMGIDDYVDEEIAEEVSEVVDKVRESPKSLGGQLKTVFGAK